MDIEIVKIDSRGTGYAVVHNDDGSTYGLQFRHAPIDSPAVLVQHLSEKAAEIEAERIELTTVPAPLPTDIRNLIQKRTPIGVRNQE